MGRTQSLKIVAREGATSPKAQTRLLQRKCACAATNSDGECEDCKSNPPLMRKGLRDASERAAVPPIVDEVLRSPGQPLEASTRAYFEPRFGHDFSKVRIHTDARAVDSAREVHALAYTVGRDVVFAAGGFRPQSREGRALIAHELAHVVQQTSEELISHDDLVLGGTDGAAEVAAEKASAAVLATDSAKSTALSDVAYTVPLATEPRSSGLIQRQASDQMSCTPAAGLTPDNCSAYLINAWWLPLAYVNNATCACQTLPDEPMANCVRKFLQDRMAATPTWLKAIAAASKSLELNPATYPEYVNFVQTVLTPRIFRDHVDAYANCCCPSGPALYPTWVAVTTVPLQPCSLVDLAIRYFGSCHGTPGAW